jgi:hypothetical protein
MIVSRSQGKKPVSVGKQGHHHMGLTKNKRREQHLDNIIGAGKEQAGR